MNNKQLAEKGISKNVVILGLVVLLALMVGIYLFAKINTAVSTEPVSANGKVAKLSDGCSSGGTCSITLENNTTIITSCAVTLSDPKCKNYDQTKLSIGSQIESTVVKASAGDYYNLDCDICTIQVK